MAEAAVPKEEKGVFVLKFKRTAVTLSATCFKENEFTTPNGMCGDGAPRGAIFRSRETDTVRTTC